MSEETKAKISAANKGRKYPRIPAQIANLERLHERLRAGEWVPSRGRGYGTQMGSMPPEIREKIHKAHQNRSPEEKEETANLISKNRILKNIEREPDAEPRRGWSCRRHLIKHHDIMKDDPERLTTEFLAEMMGCDCQAVPQRIHATISESGTVDDQDIDNNP
jgi:hypothetical protein